MSDEDPGLLELIRSGSKYIIGVDEVGLGSWAGPLVVAREACCAAQTLPAGMKEGPPSRTAEPNAPSPR